MCRGAERLPPGAAVLAEPPPSAKPDAPRARPRLWTLDPQHHCPIVGTCLPLADLQRIAKRCHFASRPDDDFGLHVEAVSHARSRNPASEAIQRHLDARYRLALARFARLKSDAELRQEWLACVDRGEVAGPLWALCTHRLASAETLQMAYRRVHMLSHQVGAGLAADTRRLAQLEQENSDLRSGLKRELSALRRQLAAAESALAQRDAALADNASLQKRLQRFESGQVMVDLGRRLMSLQGAAEELTAATRRIYTLESTLKDAHRESLRLAAERDAALSERDALEALLQASLPAADDSLCTRGGSDDCAGCPQATSERCILYVGGRAALIAQYRQLAERLGIRLIHHDGGLEESLSRLPELINGADAVLCPTDHVSHNAYYHVKSHCKRIGKPCLFYRGGGVSGFAAAMARVGRGEYSLAGQDET